MEREVCVVVPPCFAEHDTSIFSNILQDEFSSICPNVQFISHLQASYLSIDPASLEPAHLSGGKIIVCNMEEEITVSVQDNKKQCANAETYSD
jgi:hypothetical protein